MWPWGHLAFGYLLYSPTVRTTTGRAPEGPAVLALAFGTQLPDLVDKPLAWYLGVLPSGRSFMHSLLVFGAVAVVVLTLGRRYHAPAGPALVLGYASHLVGDSYRPLLAGQWDRAAFLLWPFISLPPDGITDYSPMGLLARFDLSDPGVQLELVVGLVVVVLWLRDGRPGLRTTTRACRTALGRARRVREDAD